MPLSRRSFGINFITQIVSGFIATFLGKKTRASNSHCQKDIKEEKNFLAFDDRNINYWIDGALENYKARLSILLKINQKEDYHVIKAVLATKGKITLGIRYLKFEKKIANNYPPYLIFENLPIISYTDLFLYLLIREGEQTKVYRYVFSNEKLKRTTIQNTPWPEDVKKDLSTLNSGFISNPVYPPLSLLKPEECKQSHQNNSLSSCYALHTLKSKLISIDLESSNFNMRILFEHPDISPNHYMRYFIVTDPVGKILAIKKRQFDDIYKLTIDLSAMTSHERQNIWKIDINDPSNISDCPYLMLFCEDSFDGIFISYLWLH